MAAWRYEISLLVLKKYFKRNFVSPRGHVISSVCCQPKADLRVFDVVKFQSCSCNYFILDMLKANCW